MIRDENEIRQETRQIQLAEQTHKGGTEKSCVCFSSKQLICVATSCQGKTMKDKNIERTATTQA